MLDIFVWSIEDSHRVFAERRGIKILLAAFTDIGVARNFRDWAIRTLPNDELFELMQRADDRERPTKADIALAELIIQRRKHPATDWAYLEHFKQERMPR